MIFRHIEEASGYCGRCLKQTPVRRVRVRHWPHAVLTVLTGVWAVVWIIDARRVRRKYKWRCMNCGADVYRIMAPIDI